MREKKQQVPVTTPLTPKLEARTDIYPKDNLLREELKEQNRVEKPSVNEVLVIPCGNPTKPGSGAYMVKPGSGASTAGTSNRAHNSGSNSAASPHDNTMN